LAAKRCSPLLDWGYLKVVQPGPLRTL